MELTQSQKTSLAVQRAVCLAAFLPYAILWHAVLRLIGKYRFSDQAAFRAEIKKLVENAGNAPLIICANHLTMIDSMLLGAVLFSTSHYLRSFRHLPWNLPEIQNFGRKFWVRLMCYLGKCVYVERAGSAASKDLTLAKVKYLLSQQETILIFPEGGRSRSGRVNPESASYGVGSIIQDVPGCVVLCVYMRGEAQESYSFFPKRGENFHCLASLIKPRSESQGRRGSKEIALQVMNTIKQLEDQYFTVRGN
jgi:1-acyl-sn-glycerol-3-phosphate acyltransferase